jgi:16S rRNA (adenine1518-N6/adenine1519-N6)-dimethyltransferase
MPKKSLGQNFLKSTKALSDIVSAGKVSNKDTVLEIGPGKGALTEYLLATGAKVIAIEKDRELIPLLEERFAMEISEKRFVLIEADVLEFDPKKLKIKNYKLIGNIPYYITGAIIRKFLESDFQPELAVFLVQKEVAERIVARDGKQSILSMSVQVYGQPKYIGKVSARYFTPAPKVDSAIILIDGISKLNFKALKEEDFFSVIKEAFGQKRKTLMKNLKSTYNILNLEEIFAKTGISKNARAEDLTLSQFLNMTKELFPQNKKI